MLVDLELSPARKSSSTIVLRETSVMINGENPKRSLRQSSKIHSRIATVYDHAYSFVPTKFKDSPAQITDGVIAESAIDPFTLTKRKKKKTNLSVGNYK